MSARHQVLARRIEREVLDLDRTVAVIQQHWQRALAAALDQDAYLNSVALNLHAWYCGLERLFEAIALEFDEGLPRGDAWHADLVRQMALDLTPTRGPVLDAPTTESLDEYRKFRHLVRNIYATNLNPKRIQSLVDGLPSTWIAMQDHLARFVDFLGALEEADGA